MFTRKNKFIPTVDMSKQDEDPKYPCTKAHSNEMEVVSDKKLTVTMREEAPRHYTLESSHFSFFRKSFQKLDLTDMNQLNLKRLILYPEGDKERNGGGRISLYMGIVCIQNLGRALEIDALLIFFVYDHSTNQYISIQVKREWGFSRLLPLTEFKDTSKGYLSVHENSCKFGVEVFVIRSEDKGECFSILDNPNKNQFTWVIGKFSGLSETGHYSDECTIGDYKWKLHLYPKGVPKVVYGLVAFRRLGAFHIKLADPQQSHGFIAHDHVVEAEISSISMTKDLSPETKEKSGDIDTPAEPF
ncbi:hypothetical protein CRYUN_Cryun29cG0084600 [Craigia yunnanensis]